MMYNYLQFAYIFFTATSGKYVHKKYTPLNPNKTGVYRGIYFFLLYEEQSESSRTGSFQKVFDVQ